MKWTQFKDTFEVVHAPLYNEKFIVNIESRHVFTYLDNGKGLQPHHPYLTELSPISKLNEEEYQKVLEKAHAFIRPEEADLDESERAERNKDRTFVIQVVSSYVNGPETNVHRFTHNADHPYIRMIVGRDNPVLKTYKGDVFEVGYRTKHKIPLPLTASQGQFRTPDVCEYKMCKQKVVTNIAINKEEAFAFYRYTQGYFRDSMNLGKSIGFHFVKQNCTTYVRKSLLAAGINVPTEISLDNLLREIAPDWIKQVGKVLKQTHNASKEDIKQCLFFVPNPLIHAYDVVSAKITKYTMKIFEALAALSFFPLKAALGDGSGDGGVAFASPGEKNNVIAPELSNWKTWYRLSHYKFNFPGVLQAWQRQQPSTFIKERAVKLAIVP